ncbi:uncharacterized protein A1O9_01179 [Exophiala aquamarina CBS 119918]|uniref:DUF6536 domain-containing protein n=1 Tax=Exophiala aquamarina CBS 119918 TaxID=1182545 RepID=A0A072PTX6_9EURO|nr:uncharacterized protein A1O9_01179 [Exophiala aquamarina CBS 119918]KEF63202.1 hypothetical protein A1O9_01179 [Exophiala aquamarina CBS 119918]
MSSFVSEDSEKVDHAKRHLLQPEQQHKDPQAPWSPSGWRVGATTAAGTALLSLLINVGVTIWCGKHADFKAGMAILFLGDCDRVATMNSWLHFGINGLSTVLLSGSNYCMQCLSAPTRGEVQKAHAKMKWLDIGVPSVRNLQHIQSRKVALWWCLALSSVPLHLMYNSVFFSSLSTNSYNVLYATQDFVEGGLYDTQKFPGDDMCDIPQIRRQASSWERLDNAACIRTYANDLLSQYRNVILVVSNSSSSTAANNSLLDILGYDNTMTALLLRGQSRDPYQWICDDDKIEDKIDIGDPRGLSFSIYAQPCYALVSKLEAVADQWVSKGYDIDHCLAEKVEGTCTLNFSLDIAIVVMVFNLVKILCMCYVAFWIRDRPLITVGDAVESFLRVVDDTSKGMCLLSKKQVVFTWDRYARYVSGGRAKELPQDPVTFRSKRHKWSSAASGGRWTITVLLIILALAAIASLMAYGITQLDGANDAQSLWELGVGKLHAQSLIKGWSLPSFGGSTFIFAVLIANSPQPTLSFIYLFVNGLFTSMLLANEWSDFAYKFKPLRVSSPSEGQRSTYFLQLPYRYALPLMGVSGVLHWLVSQSIFVASIRVNDRAGNLDPARSVVTCGYSIFGMAFTIIAAGLLLVVAIGLGFCRYKPGMPLVGTCSVAIAAACHPPEREKVEKEDIASLPVQWGAVPDGTNSEGAVGHCCFSSERVEMPKEGRSYAGMGSQDLILL